jgi:hypothetical protein
MLPPARRDFAGADLLIDLLEKYDAVRERQRLLAMDLSWLLETGIDPVYPDCPEVAVDVVALRQGWHDFLRAGGTSADDLRAYLRGEAIGPAARTRRHLRLIASNSRSTLRHRRPLAGHDAA